MKTGLSQGERASGTHVWEKWYWWSQYVFYGILALATALVFFFGEPSWELRGKALAAVALLAVWQWFFQLRSPGWYYSNIGIRLAHISGVSFLFVALVQIYPDYWLFAFVVFWQIWAIGSVAWSGTAAVALTLILLGMQGVPLTGLEGVLNLGAVAIASTVSIVLGLYISSLIGQSEERHRLIRELEETRAELAEEERRAGVLEERGRLAREIHDTLAQGFISIVTHLETAEEDLARDSKEARRHLAQAKQAARENLVESRRLVAALRPEILEGSSLPEALERLSASWAESSGPTLELNVTGDGINLPQELQVTLLRIAQEALSNVR